MTRLFAGRDWRTPALAVSVLLNLFMVGWEASHLFHRGPPPGPSEMIQGLVDRLAARLDPADAAILRASYAARHAELPTQDRDQLRVLMGRIRAALTADPFDPAALDAALRDGEERRAAFDRVVRAIAVDAASRMSPAGRRTVAEFGPR